ncbi:MAG: D-alanyl-D-alanine carboxypeptidase [Aquiluna sp.]|nr:D-alanyl-D-alanine carboxypeptidase [Aquiluna sp.]MCF8545983.1 D-alanyl-D-alanine carboxypeptidase [Aquiluna sp.]
MKHAIYGGLGGALAGGLVLGILFLGPLSNPTQSKEVATAAPTQTQTSAAIAEPTETQSAEEVVPKCSVGEALAADGILQLQAQVVDASNSAVLFDRSGSTPARTASVLKLVTAAAALESLGPDYTVTTRVYVDAVDPSVLYLVGAGDVTLSRLGVNEQSVYRNAPKLATLVNQISRWSNTQTFSKIVLDSSLYGAASGDWNSDWDKKGLKEGYMSQVSALQFDGDRDNPRNKDSSRGADPVARAGKWFKEAMGANAASAVVEKGVTPNSVIEIAKVTSRPISEWIQYMLVVSDNTLAEALARLVSLDQGLDGTFGSLDQAYKKALAKTGLNLSGIKIEDGSGLSDFNQASPEFINSLLGLIDKEYRNFSIIEAGMPVAGSPGSLAYRLENSEGNITAKTGWIRSGYTIAGFMDTPDGAHLIFSVYNLGKVSVANRDAMDALVMAIYNCGGNLGNE